MTEENKLTVAENNFAVSAFDNEQAFASAMKMATALSRSDLVPLSFKGKPENCLIALEVAKRTGSSIMAVTQNLDIIHGRPSWRSTYVIGAINGCGRYRALKFRVEVLGEEEIEYSWWEGQTGNKQKRTGKLKVQNKTCVAYTYDRDGELLEGPEVSIKMAVQEGWYTKSDSKWKTMPDLMLRYRAASFFGRLYAPDVLLGMHSEDEVMDFVSPEAAPPVKKGSVLSELNKQVKAPKTETPEVLEAEVMPPKNKEFY